MSRLAQRDRTTSNGYHLERMEPLATENPTLAPMRAYDADIRREGSRSPTDSDQEHRRLQKVEWLRYGVLEKRIFHVISYINKVLRTV
jgi:hypothetical protein